MADEKSESAAEGFYELNGVMAKDVAGIPMTVDEIAKAYAEGLKDGSMPYMSRPPKPAGEKELAGYLGLSARRCHEGWLEAKRANGWKYGPKADPAEKTNPYVVPFDDLPAEIKESNEAGSKAALEALSDLGLIPTKEGDLAWAIAQRLHDAWSEKKLEQGWAYGPVRDDRKKIHPDLLPYSALSDEDRSYDYEAACSALKALRDQGLALEAKLIGGPIG
jgi:hypothetical protein